MCQYRFYSRVLNANLSSFTYFFSLLSSNFFPSRFSSFVIFYACNIFHFLLLSLSIEGCFFVAFVVHRMKFEEFVARVWWRGWNFSGGDVVRLLCDEMLQEARNLNVFSVKHRLTSSSATMKDFLIWWSGLEVWGMFLRFQWSDEWCSMLRIIERGFNLTVVTYLYLNILKNNLNSSN